MTREALDLAIARALAAALVRELRAETGVDSVVQDASPVAHSADDTGSKTDATEPRHDQSERVA